VNPDGCGWEERDMAKYITFVHWTKQGEQGVKETVRRSLSATEEFERRGIRVLSCYWTQGRYDCVFTCEAPDDNAMAAAILGHDAHGNVHTETLRAFDQQEMEEIVRNI